VAAIGVLAGCSSGGSKSAVEASPAGDIPDTQTFKDYSSPDNVYAVKVPEGWALKEAPGRATFTDKLNAIDIQVADAPVAPTVELAKATEVPQLGSTVSKFQLADVTTVTRPAGNAVLITYTAEAAPDSVIGKVVRDDVERYEFWRNGKEVILTLAAPTGSDNVDPWKVVTDSFSWR
jgi:hypothetical protein